MKREVNFLDAMAKYEDVNFPLWGYTDLSADMDLKHRIRSTIRELRFVADVLVNALDRVESNVDIPKLNGCLEKCIECE